VWVQNREAGGERDRIAGERRSQMLHEVDLVDVATRDRIANADDSGGVVTRSPGAPPRADGESRITICHVIACIVITDNILLRPDGTGSERQRARFRRGRRVQAPDRRGEPVPQIQIGDESLAPGREETARTQPFLEPLERAFRLVDLDRVAAADHGRAPRAAPVATAVAATITRFAPPFVTLPSV
jgi:hypothetical protein